MRWQNPCGSCGSRGWRGSHVYAVRAVDAVLSVYADDENGKSRAARTDEKWRQPIRPDREEGAFIGVIRLGLLDGFHPFPVLLQPIGPRRLRTYRGLKAGARCQVPGVLLSAEVVTARFVCRGLLAVGSWPERPGMCPRHKQHAVATPSWPLAYSRGSDAPQKTLLTRGGRGC